MFRLASASLVHFFSHTSCIYSEDHYYDDNRSFNHCNDIILIDEDHDCAEDVADAIEDAFEDTSVNLGEDCNFMERDLCLMIPDDEDDCGALTDAFVKFLRKTCFGEIRGGWDYHDDYFPNAIRCVFVC